MSKYDIEQILDALNEHKIRVTYTAVAELLHTNAISVAGQYLGEHRPRSSWVVNKQTGLPTDYLIANCHPELQSKSHVIEDPAELIDLIEGR